MAPLDIPSLGGDARIQEVSAKFSPQLPANVTCQLFDQVLVKMCTPYPTEMEMDAWRWNEGAVVVAAQKRQHSTGAWLQPVPVALEM
jgi:hypothetical protein